MTTPIEFRGDVRVLVNSNNRYGNGKLIIDSGIESLKEIATPAAPASTYHNIFVDSTTKKVRVQNNSNITKDVGINSLTIPQNIQLTSGTYSVLNRVTLPGSSRNGIPSNIFITVSGTAGRTFDIRIVDIATVLTICEVTGIVIPAAGFIVQSMGIISNYPSADVVARIDGLRSNNQVILDSIFITY